MPQKPANPMPELKVDKHMLQQWYVQASGIATQIFHVALDGTVSRQRLLDISEALDNLANRVDRAAGGGD